MREPIDLHTHSSVSDGTETPTELVEAAISAGLGTVALTDHDTTSGWEEAFAAATGTGLTVIGGMELSTRIGHASVHLLAYLVDPDDQDLREETLRIREDRLTRAEKIVSRLAADFDISWTDVLTQVTGDATIGRPHIADALVARGAAADRSAAFRDILHPKFGYYVPHYAPHPLKAIELVRAAGGVPVLAHPATRGIDAVVPKEHLSQLVDAGLFGLELRHRENRPEGVAILTGYAAEFGLAITGSSDYHGDGKPNRLGENTTEREDHERIGHEATGTTPFFG